MGCKNPHKCKAGKTQLTDRTKNPVVYLTNPVKISASITLPSMNSEIPIIFGQ